MSLIESALSAIQSSQSSGPESDTSGPSDSGGRRVIGKLGGAVAGAALGAIAGPTGLLWGAILGLVLGDEYERRSQSATDGSVTGYFLYKLIFTSKKYKKEQIPAISESQSSSASIEKLPLSKSVLHEESSQSTLDEDNKPTADEQPADASTSETSDEDTEEPDTQADS